MRVVAERRVARSAAIWRRTSACRSAGAMASRSAMASACSVNPTTDSIDETGQMTHLFNGVCSAANNHLTRRVIVGDLNKTRVL